MAVLAVLAFPSLWVFLHFHTCSVGVSVSTVKLFLIPKKNCSLFGSWSQSVGQPWYMAPGAHTVGLREFLMGSLAVLDLELQPFWSVSCYFQDALVHDQIQIQQWVSRHNGATLLELLNILAPVIQRATSVFGCEP